MKIGPKATQNHEKLTLESWEIQFLQKLAFAIAPLPNAWFSNPRHPDSDPKIIRKSNLEINMKKNMFFQSECTQKSLSMGPPNQPEIDKIQAWTSQCPFMSSLMSQDRPRIVPGQ